MKPKKYSKAWLKSIISAAHATPIKTPEFSAFLQVLDGYVEHLDQIDANRGKGTSELKAATSAENGRKGGRPRKVAK